jgi:hypothetical protein
LGPAAVRELPLAFRERPVEAFAGCPEVGHLREVRQNTFYLTAR